MQHRPRRTPAPTRALGLALSIAATAAGAAPYTPASDDQVLATVPARATDPQARQLAALRAAWQRDPRDAAAAVRLAQAHLDALAADGDARRAGQAQAALAPWWQDAAPPPGVRVLRALLLQFDHRFDAALADLDAVLAADPRQAQAAAWRCAILMVRADYAGARAACQALAPLATPLIGAACRAQVDAATGRAAAAAAALRAALQAAPGADPAEKLWALTRLAEIEERHGDAAAAEAAFRAALALRRPDVYLQAAYADFLLDRGRAAEVAALLPDARADVLLLRRAIAARAAGEAGADRLAAELAARFDAARQRGDASHRKEEARYRLALRGDAAGALALARQNWDEQKEPADARVLLEAAVAAGDAAAARPVLDWMRTSGIESVALQALAARLPAGRR